MSRLETAVEPVLTPLVFGRPATLSVEDQELLATWCTKTALVMEFKNPQNRTITDELLRRFGDEQKPLPNAHVYIARYIGDDWSTNRSRMGLHINFDGEIPREDMQLSTFCAWKFIFQVMFDPSDHISRDDSRYVIRIHPSDGERKRWPPELGLTSEQFYAFSAADKPPNIPADAEPDGIGPPNSEWRAYLYAVQSYGWDGLRGQEKPRSPHTRGGGQRSPTA